MKVISFKVDDKIYHALKKKNVSFRVLFEPLATQLARNNTGKTKYTGVYHQNSSDLYIYLSQAKKEIEKMMKSCDDDKTEV